MKLKKHTKMPDKSVMFILNNFDSMTNSELGSKLNLTNAQVRGIYRIYGLKRIEGNGRFSTGDVPKNKGVKMTAETRAKVSKTFFTKGHKPHNTLSDGSIVTRKDNSGRQYKFIRVSINNWELLHRWVFEANFGAIPEGFIVSFKDGNSMNCKASNLKLITRQENMSNNQIHQYPEELKELIRTLNQLKKTIKNGKK